MNSRDRIRVLVALSGLAFRSAFADDASAKRTKDLPVWAKDYQTSTGLVLPVGTVVTVRAKGVWGIWGNGRRCSAAGDAKAQPQGKSHWPVDGAPEGTLLIWFGDQVHYYPWKKLADNDYETSFAFQGSAELRLGPNDNHLEDNAEGGYLTVQVSW